MNNRSARKPIAIAQTRTVNLRLAVLSATMLVAGAFLATDAFGQDNVTKSHGFSFLGTLKYPADFEQLDYVNANAPKGGEFSTWTLGTFDSFQPYARKGTTGWGASFPMERIMSGTSDEIDDSYCLLCETLEYPDDHSWVIFNLRPEVTFSNGTPMTAEDIAFTHELFMEQGLESYRMGVSQVISSVEALDDHTLKVTFNPESQPRERIGQAGALVALSKAQVESEERRLDESYLTPWIGTGAYVLDSFEVNEQIIYRRNPDYWGENLPLNIGQNNFDTLRVEYFGDTNAAFEGFKAGEYFFRKENQSKQWATAYDFPALVEGHVVKAELYDGTQASGQGYALNMRKERFQDIRVREALQLMFNFEWANEALFYGAYERINSFADNSYNKAEGLPSADELRYLEPIADKLRAGVIDSEPVMAPVSGDRQFDRANARRASQLLDEAGWLVGDDGMRRNAAGETLDFEILSYSPSFDRVHNPYVDNLRQIGVNASMNRVDTAQYIDRLYAFDYDTYTDQIALGYEPAGGLKQSLGSEAAAVSVFNSTGLANEAVDYLIDQIIGAETQADLVPAVRALDRVLRAERITVPQWFNAAHRVAYFDFYAYPDPLPPYALGEMSFWWFDQDRYDELKAAGVIK